MINNIESLVSVLKIGLLVRLKEDGTWTIRPRVPGLKTVSNSQLVSSFISQLEQLETVPVEFSLSGEQPIPFRLYTEAAELIEERCTSYSRWMIGKPLARLKRLRLALLYRMEKGNGGLSPSRPCVYLMQKIVALAADWKKKQFVFWDTSLTNKDRSILKQVIQYKEFVQLLLEQSDLLEEFFSWALRDGVAIEPFILFPYHQRKIVQAGLNERIGSVNGQSLKVKKVPKENGLQKVLTLPFEGVDIGILDSSKQVLLRGDRLVTVEEVFEVFRNKFRTPGTIEYFADGVYSWDGHRSSWGEQDKGTLNQVDLSHPLWWESIPVFNRLTIEEAQERYGAGMDGYHWCISAKSARGIPTMTYEKTHAYIEVTIPNGNGYHVYNFGKIAFDYPVTRWEEISSFAATVPATISYPDENAYFTHRQHAGYMFIVGPEMGKKVMASIAEDMQLARDDGVVFQIESENCGRWIQELLEEYLGKENVPNIYKVNLVEARPIGFAKIFWMIARTFPKAYQGRVLALVHFVFAPWRGEWVWSKKRGREKKCLTKAPFWQNGIVYLPTYLHKQYEDKIKHLSEHVIHIDEESSQLHKNLDLFEDSA